MKKEPITDKNSEGYADKTASSAMKAADKTQQGFKDGDIVTIDTNGKEAEVVLVRCFDNYAVNTALLKFQPDQNSYMVNINGAIRFVDAGHMYTIGYDRIWDIGGRLTAEQIKGLRREMAKAFSISREDTEPETKEPEEPETRMEPEEVMKAIAEIRELVTPAKSSGAETEVLKVQLEDLRKTSRTEMAGRIKAEAQRDIWKDLYEQERQRDLKQ